MKCREIVLLGMISALLILFSQFGGSMDAGWDSDKFVDTRQDYTVQTPPPTYTPRPTPSSTPWPFTTIYVPYDFSTIQEALNEAVAHTQILVMPGTYCENLVWSGCGGIRLDAAEGSGSVTVNGMYNGRVLTIQDVPVPGAIINGFRLHRGKHTDGGAGIFIKNSTVILSNCEIFNNEAVQDGLTLNRPGIDCRESQLTMTGCHIHNHIGLHTDGCGLTISNSDQLVWIEGCRFSANYLYFGGRYGASVSLHSGSAVFKHCEFLGNGALEGSVIFADDTILIEHSLFSQTPSEVNPAQVVLMNSDNSFFIYNTISDNSGCGVVIGGSEVLLRGNIICGNDTGVALLEKSSAILEYNNIWNNIIDYDGITPGSTDFSVDPIFTEGSNGLYYLSQVAAGQDIDSPCVDAGDETTEPAGYTRTDHVPDQNIIDTGFHRSSCVPSPVPSWTPTPNTSPSPGPPTPTPVYPTNTPPAGTILVPEHYSTIQEAIDAAGVNDIINVAPGTYMGNGNRDLDFRGKNITVESRNGSSMTIIDCGGSFGNPHRAFLFNHNETNEAVLRGFTIRNGFEIEGGGIWIHGGADPSIQNCKITDCTATSYGGGIYADDSNLILESSVVSDCFASDGGGGMMISGQDSYSAIVYRTTFSNNNCSTHIGGGGGLFVRDNAKPYLTSCIFKNNQGIALVIDSDNDNDIQIANCLFTENQGGMIVRTGKVQAVNCTFSDNSGFAVKGKPPDGIINVLRSCLWGPEDFAMDINETNYSNIPGGTQENKSFYDDPLFVTGHFGDYYLKQNTGEPFSPNVNRGGAPAFTVSFTGPYYRIALTQLTTAANDETDERFSDIGYHYYPSNLGPTPTPEPTHSRPIIEDVLGSTEHFDESSETVMLISAQIDHPLGPNHIDTVELYLDDNIPLNFYLTDDNNDGRYSTELHFVTSSIQPGNFQLNIVAFGKDGNPSEMAPYQIQFNSETLTQAPKISGKHIWYSIIESGKNEMGFLWILARITHPLGINHIDSVELFYENEPTGIKLHDDGLHQDIAASDGYFGTMILYNGVQIPDPVEVSLDIRATDKDGNTSFDWPISWKAQ